MPSHLAFRSVASGDMHTDPHLHFLGQFSAAISPFWLVARAESVIHCLYLVSRQCCRQCQHGFIEYPRTGRFVKDMLQCLGAPPQRLQDMP